MEAHLFDCVIEVNDPELLGFIRGDRPNPEPQNKNQEEQRWWFNYLLWGIGIVVGLFVMLFLWRWLFQEDESLNEIPETVENRYASVRKKMEAVRAQMNTKVPSEGSDTESAGDPPHISRSGLDISIPDSEVQSIFQ